MSTMEVRFEEVREIVQAAFPGEVSRRTVKVDVTAGEYQVSDYWSEGSRNIAVFVELATMRSIPATSLPSEVRQKKNNPHNLAIGRVQVTPGIVVVENIIYCGKNMGFRIHIHPDNVTKTLPSASTESKVDSRDLRILVSYRSLKSGPYRQEALSALKVTKEDIDRLVESGYLARNARGAISLTQKGRIACANEI